MLAQLAADDVADVRDAATKTLQTLPPQRAAPGLRSAAAAPALELLSTLFFGARRARAHHRQPAHARHDGRAHRANGQRSARRTHRRQRDALLGAPRIIEALYKNKQHAHVDGRSPGRARGAQQHRPDRHPRVQGSRRSPAGPADPGAERRAAAAGRDVRPDAGVRREPGLERRLPGRRRRAAKRSSSSSSRSACRSPR